MKATQLVIGFTVAVMTLLTSGQTFAAKGERVKLDVQFANEAGQTQAGKLDLFVIAHSDGTASVSDITSRDGDRFPIALRTGFAGKSYMFQTGANNERALCGALGYSYGALSSVSAQGPKVDFNYSKVTIVTDNSGSFLAAGDYNTPSVSTVKCCKSAKCEADGE